MESLRNWKLEGYLVEILGAEKLCDSILEYLNADTCNEILEGIANDWEIEPFC